MDHAVALCRASGRRALAPGQPSNSFPSTPKTANPAAVAFTATRIAWSWSKQPGRAHASHLASRPTYPAEIGLPAAAAIQQAAAATMETVRGVGAGAEARASLHPSSSLPSLWAENSPSKFTDNLHASSISSEPREEEEEEEEWLYGADLFRWRLESAVILWVLTALLVALASNVAVGGEAHGAGMGACG